MFKYWMFLFAPHSLFALTILHVSQPSDNNPGGIGEMGDLRFALNTMNQDLNGGSLDNYEIVFDFPMTISLNGILPIVNTSSTSVNIAIGNSDPTFTVAIDGNGGTFSGFFIPTGTVTIQNMTFQNLTAKGGNGGDGISGGGGGMGAGGAIHAPQSFFHNTAPIITLINVSTNNCSAVGGSGGSYNISSTGNEGGGCGGGFSGNGGSIMTTGSTGGGGGGGFGGDGGNVTVSVEIDPLLGGGGGGGGGIGSRATIAPLTNLGTGGPDNNVGLNGNAYGLAIAGTGAGNYSGGVNGGGGGGGDAITTSTFPGGGGDGSTGELGQDGLQPAGSIPPGGNAAPSGGKGADGGGGGGGGVVRFDATNHVDGEAGSGGYGGGGGGGAGLGNSDTIPVYTVQGGSGGVGGGGGGGGVNVGSTSAAGGDSLGGGGGGGGGPANGPHGSDIGLLGGGTGGDGAPSSGLSFGGGGGGGGSALGGSIFLDSGVTLILQALSGIPTTFNTSYNITPIQAGSGGSAGSGGGGDGNSGSALGNSIFLRSNSNPSLVFIANDANDLLILGDQVAFTDDTSFGGTGTSVSVKGNGTVVYNGTTDYQGTVTINNANFKVNGQINEASISVCRNVGFSSQRGTLSGIGTLTGNVVANSGTISPDTGGTLTLGSLTLNSANPGSGALGSLVHIEINSSGTSLVSVTGSASLAGVLEIDLDPNAVPGTYTVLTSSGITHTFDSVTFTGTTPNYSLSYLPLGSPTFVQFDFLGYPSPLLSTQGLRGNNLRVAKYLNSLFPDAASLGLTDQFELLNDLSPSQYRKALKAISPSRNSISTFAAQNVMFMFSESLNSHFTKRRLARNHSKNRYAQESAFQAENEFLAVDRSPNKTIYTSPANPDSQLWAMDFDQFGPRISHNHPPGREMAFLEDNELLAINRSPRKTIYAPPKNTHSQLWAMGFGQFSSQDSQDQTPGFDFNSGGFFAAYDYGNTDQGCIGALAGYAHSSIHDHQSMGNSHINAGYLSIYGMRFFSDFFIDAAIWGEYMGVNQKRIISFPGFKETAKSSYHAEQLDLHLGTGYDFNIKTVTIEPFGVLDWVYEWDPSYSEKGAAPYNMKVSSRNSWMLRFETGLNGYKTTTYNWGIFIAQAKLSYVYKKPHHVGHLNAAIVNAPASFVVEAFTSEQSLVSPALELFWQTNWNGYGSISYDGEFGSGYNSNQFYGKIGYSF